MKARVKLVVESLYVVIELWLMEMKVVNGEMKFERWT